MKTYGRIQGNGRHICRLKPFICQGLNFDLWTGIPETIRVAGPDGYGVGLIGSETRQFDFLAPGVPHLRIGNVIFSELHLLKET